MAPPLLTLQDIHHTFGGTPLLEGAELQVFARDRLCIVGRNGSGKSTLLKIAAGLTEPERGTRFLQPGVTVHYLAQEPDLSRFASVLDYVLHGHLPDGTEHHARRLLAQLRVPADACPTTLSGGESRRAALARSLALQADILLLDEPTNHLDLPTILWLEGELTRLPSALVLISHDRRFLETLSRRTLWLERGQTRLRDKGFAGFEAWRDSVLEQQAADAHKLARKIDRETHWLIHGVTGRRKRNQRRLAALHNLRRKHKEALARTPASYDTTALASVEARTSGKLVLEAQGLNKSWNGQPVVRDFSMRLVRGERVGLIGPNGAGKTTLVQLLTGRLAPDSGTLRFGTRLEVVTLDQRREELSDTVTLQDVLTQGRGDMVQVGESQRHVISYMKDFLFAPEQARTPTSRLSGGERGRLMLARAFARPSNMLVLDEPTNDLDMETLDLLEELLGTYQGTVLLVSHDRDFLDRTVTRVLATEGDGIWTSYAGGYSDMLAQQKGRPAAPARRTAAKSGSSPTNRARTDRAASRGAGQKQRRKLSFKDAHALKTLPGEIAALQKEVSKLQEALANPTLYSQDPQKFQDLSTALDTATQALAAKEERWLELELLREELESKRD